MKQIFNTFFDICLLRAGPQDVPFTRHLLFVLLGLHVLVGILLGSLSYSLPTAIAYGFTNMLVLVVLLRAVLMVRKLPERFNQTLSAMAGTDVIIGVIAWPISSWMVTARDAGSDVGAPALLWLLLVIWSLTIIAHILRNALSAPWAVGVVLAVLYFFIGYNVSITLFEPLPVK